MQFAMAKFDEGNMEPALYCIFCAVKHPSPAWDAVILSSDDDFCCDGCFSTKAPSCDVNNSALIVERIVSKAKGN